MLKQISILLFMSTFFLLGLANARFYTNENLVEYPVDFQHARSSAIELTTEFGNWCTGTAISNDGYLLTDLHCLRACFELAEGAFEDYVQKVDGDIYTGWKMKSRNGKGAACKGYFSFDDGAFNYDEPEVIWVGKGRAAFEDEKVAELSPQALQFIKNWSDDYAILKFKTPYKNIPCVPLSKKDAKAGDKLWSVGFPAATKRNDGYDSNGKGQFISIGTARENIQADPYLKSIYNSEVQWKNEALIFNQPRFLITSLDSMAGSSGSLIVNENSELVGILFAKIGVSAEKDTGGSTLAIRSSHIYSEVVKGLGLKKAQEIFKCDPDYLGE